MVTLRAPHSPARKGTLARWMKYGLRLAGVNLKRWGAHSTRSAATSYVESRGVGLSDIPKTADWKSDSCFRRFYQAKTVGTSSLSAGIAISDSLMSRG